MLRRAQVERRSLFLLTLAGFLVAFDQCLKQWALLRLPLGEAVTTKVPFFELRLRQGGGLFFGLLPGLRAPMEELFFVGVPIFALVLIVLIFLKLRNDQPLVSLALTTVLAGAVSNLVDRVAYGYVVDFLGLHAFGRAIPSFNVADVSILLGVLLLFVDTLRGDGQRNAV